MRKQRILVVDGSRVVRATLSKHLQANFTIVEEADGESAWQTLMLDPCIDAVICGLSLPKLDGRDLLIRLRASAKRNLRSIPLVLIVPDTFSPDDREAELRRGASGFITKSSEKPAILACLDALLTPSAATDAAGASADQTEFSSKILDDNRFRQRLTSITFDKAPPESVCVLVFAIDHRDRLIASFGVEIIEAIAARIAALLIGKVGPLDTVGRCRGERLAILSHGVDLKHGVRFGKQVCKGLAAGQLSIRGRKIRLTASVGVASSIDDQIQDGQDLLVLAENRLEQALVCGGNTVSTDYRPDCPLHCHGKSLARLLDALNNPACQEALRQNMGELGLKLLPILALMDKELSLELPLPHIAAQLELRRATQAPDADTDTQTLC